MSIKGLFPGQFPKGYVFIWSVFQYAIDRMISFRFEVAFLRRCCNNYTYARMEVETLTWTTTGHGLGELGLGRYCDLVLIRP